MILEEFLVYNDVKYNVFLVIFSMQQEILITMIYKTEYACIRLSQKKPAHTIQSKLRFSHAVRKHGL